MKASRIIILVVVVFLVGFFCLFLYNNKLKTLDVLPSNGQSTQEELSASEIMEIIKTDKDYAELSEFIKDFEPQIVSYEKLGPAEYGIIKIEWQNAGFEERIKMVDEIKLTDSTYWIELKNKNDETKGLLVLLDVKEKKSFLLIAALSISVGVGI